MFRSMIRQLCCMRCGRETELTPTDDLKDAGMIEIGHNLYYCFTCANVTGHPKAPGAAKLPKHTK
ncbi:hypothetical protein CABS03_15090 [Colletotrichum abscissum]|uniref:Uncharacterized protein n=3 Tax=Colletotrichum acutatum species complex TaxID=2707335 RepID=A0A9P9X3D6_9PEZI|nr:hypothetical protein CABS02_13175 [Colletotrichum abscissum]KAK0367629.1 hypothetical protein CLIM01_15015 [Colletotrichum limetticola]